MKAGISTGLLNYNQETAASSKPAANPIKLILAK
jgi:hypothetical protein